jgi:undecaprenyl-diphosphatase
MAVDIDIFFFLHDLAHRSGAGDRLVIFVAEYWPYLSILSLILAITCLSLPKMERARLFIIPVLSGAIARFVFVEFVYLSYQRPRPFLALPIDPLFMVNEWSFPSGHAAFYFALAMAVFLQRKTWGIWFFVSAVLITTARIIAGVHYPSDIIAGASIGIGTAWIVSFGLQRSLSLWENRITKT